MSHSEAVVIEWAITEVLNIREVFEGKDKMLEHPQLDLEMHH